MNEYDRYRTWALSRPKVLTTSLRVLFYCLPDLDGREYRPIRQRSVARALHISQSRVSKALAALVDDAYLVPGPRDGSRNTYRLNLTHVALHQLTAHSA